jgi:hypothetical protein
MGDYYRYSLEGNLAIVALSTEWVIDFRQEVARRMLGIFRKKVVDE